MFQPTKSRLSFGIWWIPLLSCSGHHSPWWKPNVSWLKLGWVQVSNYLKAFTYYLINTLAAGLRIYRTWKSGKNRAYFSCFTNAI